MNAKTSTREINPCADVLRSVFTAVDETELKDTIQPTNTSKPIPSQSIDRTAAAGGQGINIELRIQDKCRCQQYTRICSFLKFQLPLIGKVFIIRLMKFANTLGLKLNLLNPLLAR